jgi:hypothetical protein
MGNYLRLGAFGGGGSVVKVRIEIIHLTQEIIDAKQVVLPFTPSESMNLLVNNVAKQILGLGYELNGNILTWANKDLDGFLEVGMDFFCYY